MQMGGVAGSGRLLSSGLLLQAKVPSMLALMAASMAEVHD